MIHTITEVNGMDKKEKERNARKSFNEEFNSITNKVKVENQNQTHNSRER